MQDSSNENIIHIKNGDVEYLQFKKLLEFDNITHAFSLKLDFGTNAAFRGDEEKYIKNYKVLCDALNLDYKNSIRPDQEHTNIVRRVDTNIGFLNEQLTNVDGLTTNKKDLILSLTFADCIPIYLYDPINKAIANIHSGWRGTLQTISIKAVEEMVKQYNSKKENIICCIGPAICKEHFEVDEDVANKFWDKFKHIKDIDKIITKGRFIDNKQKYHIDTNLINQRVLEDIGLKKENIIQSNICTVCNKDILHSHRGMAKKAGRNASIIAIK